MISRKALMMSLSSRRGFLASSLAAIGVVFVPSPGLTLTDADARALVDRAVNDINRVISSGQPMNAMIREFEQVFQRYADVNIIARSTLGPDARRLSSSQMNAFTQAFRGYMARKYGRRFNEFKGGRIDVQSVGPVNSWHEVRAVARIPGQSPVDVRFLVSDRSGRDLFFDIVIEGISLRLTERTEIGAMLDRRNGDIDALISDLRSAG
jgi:phospholipid transport system substrate-binding protein